MISLAPLVPLFPLLGALVAAVGGKWLKQHSHWPVVLGIAAAFCASLSLLGGASAEASPLKLFDWLTVGQQVHGDKITYDLYVPMEFRVDGLTTMMLSMVTFVATLVAVFASGYMAGDPAYPRFFALVGLFVFSMTGLVLSNNYIVTYGFWEGVGVCSYMLVGFWHAKPSAAAAAKKAFLVNRVGDFGFAIAIFWMWTVFGHSTSYNDVLNPENLANVPQSAKVGIALLLVWAATAKSAQLPLYVWLPDAMEGPTPVSALIHAATMVTAGVYLLARSSLLVVSAPAVQATIAVVGCLTALLAALIALTQNDLKRVMAYSTISQLGYMFMGLGAGVGSVAKLAVTAAMFHLFTHAFFKALLFLASGSVMHAMGGVIDMRRFGGLRRRLPYTFWTFTVGGLALAGIFPFAGFWSKDEILLSLKLASHASTNFQFGYSCILWTAIFTAFLTAFYTGRAYFLTFFGPEKLPTANDPEAEPVDDSHGHAHGDDSHGGHDAHMGHESPPIMWVPLVILALCALLVGVAFGPTKIFEHHILAKTPGFEELGLLKGAVEHEVEAPYDYSVPIIGTVAGVLGLALAYVFYASPSPIPKQLATRLSGLYRASLNKFYVDEFYNNVVIVPTRALAFFCKFFDVYFIDGLVRLVAWIPRFVGKGILGPLQNGLIQYYAAATAICVAGLLLILLLI